MSETTARELIEGMTYRVLTDRPHSTPYAEGTIVVALRTQMPASGARLCGDLDAPAHTRDYWLLPEHVEPVLVLDRKYVDKDGRPVAFSSNYATHSGGHRVVRADFDDDFPVVWTRENGHYISAHDVRPAPAAPTSTCCTTADDDETPTFKVATIREALRLARSRGNDVEELTEEQLFSVLKAAASLEDAGL